MALRAEGGDDNIKKAQILERKALINLGRGTHPVQDIDPHSPEYVKTGPTGVKSHSLIEKGRPHADDYINRPKELDNSETHSKDYWKRFKEATE